MIWNNQGHELDEFSRKWKSVKDIYVFGFGQKFRNYVSPILGDLNIVSILDNDPAKSGSFYKGIEVFHPSQMKDHMSSHRIVITTHYQDVAEQLTALGLKEDEDFCEINKFISMWYWYNRKQVHIPQTHMALTTKCTLRCKHCNMFIPFYNNHGIHEALETNLDTLDLYFNMIDKVYLFVLLGGEPFLYPNLKEIVHHIGSHYRHKIGEFRITTNGMIVPKKDVIDLLHEHRVSVRSSNYTAEVDYKNRLSILEDQLQSGHVDFNHDISDEWLDFGYPYKPMNISDQNLITHMHECLPVFKGINDGKFYYCHLTWSAVKCGLLEEDTNDSLDMKQLDPQCDTDRIKLLEYQLGYMHKGYVSLCRQCAGCGRTNTMVVPVAEQIKM
jgi:organic radical activating enzyme